MIKLCAFADEYSVDLDEQIEGLKKNKISLLEIRKVNGVNIADMTEEMARECCEKLSANGIRVWSLGSPMGKVDVNCDFEAYKQTIHHLCKLAKIFGTDKIRMFSFHKAYEDFDKVVLQLKEMLHIAEIYGVGLYHENEKRIYGDTIEHVLEIYHNVPGLRFVYDPANFIQCEQDCGEAMDRLWDITEYFHIKDVVAETGELVPAGYGAGKIKELVKRIDKDTVMTLEPHLAIFEGYKDIDGSEMKHKFLFEDSKAAFNCAVESLKTLLVECGYTECDGSYIKQD